jgi:hypothetical protein
MSCAHSAGRAERGCALRSPQRVLPSWPVQRSWVAEGNLSDALSDIGRRAAPRVRHWPVRGRPAGGGSPGLSAAAPSAGATASAAGPDGRGLSAPSAGATASAAGPDGRSAVLRRRSESWRAGPGPGTRSLGQSCSVQLATAWPLLRLLWVVPT